MQKKSHLKNKKNNNKSNIKKEYKTNEIIDKNIINKDGPSDNNEKKKTLKNIRIRDKNNIPMNMVNSSKNFNNSN